MRTLVTSLVPFSLGWILPLHPTKWEVKSTWLEGWDSHSKCLEKNEDHYFSSSIQLFQNDRFIDDLKVQTLLCPAIFFLSTSPNPSNMYLGTASYCGNHHAVLQ